MKSRYNARHSKRKQNIILNSLIGIVGVVILILVANIFFSGNNSEPTSGEETASTETTQSASDNNNSNNTEDTVSSDEASGSDETNDTDSKNEESNQEDESNTEDENAQDEESTEETNGEVNLEGPWEPVGTSQESDNHVSSYEQGSTDWNEKLAAVETVVGFPKEEMVVHWLGGNGGPQKSEATVSQKGGDGTQYVVELEWVDEKGWKPVSAKEK